MTSTPEQAGTRSSSGTPAVSRSSPRPSGTRSSPRSSGAPTSSADDPRDSGGDILRRIEDLILLYRELDGLPTLPPLRGYALAPDTVRVLLELVRTRRPAHVLECGSGASTVLLGHALERNHVKTVLALEHHEGFRLRTLAAVRAAGLGHHLETGRLRVVHAPLNDSVNWYSLPPLDDLPAADLLLVDGPPGSTGPLARYPALPVLTLAGLLAPGCLVLLDDAKRPDEAEVVRRWQAEFPLRELPTPSTEKGLTLLEHRPDAAGPGPHTGPATP